MNPVRRILVGALLTVVVAATSSPAAAQVVSREAELKGKIVALLGRLVTWPAGTAPTSRRPLTIGIMGTDPFVNDAEVNHLKLKLPKADILRFPDADAFKTCHILVVARDADLKAALAKAKGPILVVCESPDSASKGAAMNLVFDRARNTIRLEINPRTAIAAGLKIDGGLLGSSLVDIVR
jgi:hypothetical protein